MGTSSARERAITSSRLFWLAVSIPSVMIATARRPSPWLAVSRAALSGASGRAGGPDGGRGGGGRRPGWARPPPLRPRALAPARAHEHQRRGRHPPPAVEVGNRLRPA